MWRILLICVGALTITLTLGEEDDVDPGSGPEDPSSGVRHTVYNFRPASLFAQEGQGEDKGQDGGRGGGGEMEDDQYRSHIDRFQDFPGGGGMSEDDDRHSRSRPPTSSRDPPYPNPNRRHHTNKDNGRHGHRKNMDRDMNRSEEDGASLDRHRPDQRKYYYGSPTKAPPVQPRGAAKKPSWKDVARDEPRKKHGWSGNGPSRGFKNDHRSEPDGRSMDSESNWSDMDYDRDRPHRRPTTMNPRSQPKNPRKDGRYDSSKNSSRKEPNHGQGRDDEGSTKKGKPILGPNGVFVMRHTPSMSDREPDRNRDHDRERPRPFSQPRIPVNDFMKRPPSSQIPRVQSPRPQTRSDSGLSDAPYGRPEDSQGAGIGIIVSRRSQDDNMDSNKSDRDDRDRDGRTTMGDDGEEEQLLQNSRRPWGAFGTHHGIRDQPHPPPPRDPYQKHSVRDSHKFHRGDPRHKSMEQQRQSQNHRHYPGQSRDYMKDRRRITEDSAFVSKRLQYEPPSHKPVYDVYHHY